MKKNAVAATWVLALSLAMIALIPTAKANTPLLDRALPLQNLSSQLTTPQAVADFLWKNFTFEEDQRTFGREDYWQSPQEFLENQKGDCEDFALLAQKILELNGVQSFILSIYGKSEGHTICVFKENGLYQAFDGTELKRVNASSLDELIEKISPDWERASIIRGVSESAQGLIAFTLRHSK